MPFHQWNSVFSCEFWWWLWFEWEQKAAFPQFFKCYRQEHILGLHYLIYVFVAKTQRGNNWGKTRLRLKLFWNNANRGFEEYQSRMIQSCQMWFFFLSLLWNEISAEKDLTLQSASLPTNLISLMESGSIPAFSSQTCNLPFPGPDLFLCSTCFLVIETSPKLWERNQNSSGYFKVWKWLCQMSCHN